MRYRGNKIRPVETTNEHSRSTTEEHNAFFDTVWGEGNEQTNERVNKQTNKQTDKHNSLCVCVCVDIRPCVPGWRSSTDLPCL